MRHIPCAQNTPEWYKLRLGKPTASQFHRILLPTGGISKQKYGYMYELIYERILKRGIQKARSTYWQERGHHLEPLAAKAFEEIVGRPLIQLGLLVTDDERIGASPDRVLDWTHAVEIKCPQPWKHIQYSVMGPGNDYLMQMRGHMWVGGFEKVSFFSFCPGMPSVIHTVERDVTVMRIMDKLLPLFVDELEKHEKQARALGNYEHVEVNFGRPVAEEDTVDDGAEGTDY
jgi:hypothetical protein